MLLINKHTTTADLAITANGSLEALFALCVANKASITDDLVPGALWQAVAVDLASERVIIERKTVVATAVLKKHQTFADFVTQRSGALEGLFESAKLNELSITTDVAAGTQLIQFAVDKDVISFFQEKGIDVISSSLNAQVFMGGIGYMQIGTSFKVS